MAVAGDAGEQGLVPTTDQFGVALGDIVRCRTCGHMQLGSFPAEAELADAYGEAASEDYVGEEEGQRQTARGVLDRIERHSGSGRILDLGCWVGFLLAEARARGWEAKGVEPSRFASAYAREKLGLDVVTSELTEIELDPGSFDAIVMADVIEHLPDTAATLAHVRSLLRPGGVLALALPDAGSRLARLMGKRWWSILPTHVHYFTRASMVVALRGGGFIPIEVSTAPKAFTVDYYLGRLAGYSPSVSGGLVRAADALGLGERMWAPDFGDRMLVLATPDGSHGPSR